MYMEAPMSQLTRATALRIAAGITAVLSLIEIFVYQLPYLIRGQTAVDLDAAQTGGPPFFLIPIQFALHAIALVAAYGAWRGQRWGVVLLIVLSVLNIIPGLLGALFAPSPGTRIYAVVSVILDILIIVLCLWRERKSAGQVAHVS